MYNVILATTKDRGIGLKGGLPWHCSEELKLFKSLTLDSVLIVGKKTAMSIPFLPRRTVLVLSHHPCCFSSIDQAVQHAIQHYPGQKIFVAGGKSVYEQCFRNPERIQKVYFS